MEKKAEEIVYIALCDDERFFHDDIEELIEQYGKLRGLKIKLIHFFSANELLEYQDNIHILLLDICMPGTDGIEAGHILRQNRKDYRIIMLTGMKERAAEAMKIGAFRFVEKPVTKGDELFEALDEALVTFLGYVKLSVRFKNQDIDIYQYRIEYIKAMGNYVKLYCGDRVYEKTVSMNNLEKELDGRIFIRTDKSYAVNLAYVEDIGKNKCFLTSGVLIPVSRRASKAFNTAYATFDAKGYNGIRNGCFY